MAIVVCKLYKLGIFDGHVSTEHRKLERGRCVITEAFMKKNNDNYKDTCRWYELDEKATADYLSLSEKQVETRQEKKDIEAVKASNVLKNALDTVIDKEETKKTRKTKS